jgi:hypothetical protein
MALVYICLYIALQSKVMWKNRSHTEALSGVQVDDVWLDNDKKMNRIVKWSSRTRMTPIIVA